jgi:hypothetical protein
MVCLHIYIYKSAYSVQTVLTTAQSHYQSRTSNNAVDIAPDVETLTTPPHYTVEVRTPPESHVVGIERRRKRTSSECSTIRLRRCTPPLRAASLSATQDGRRNRNCVVVVELTLDDVTSTWFARNAHTAQSISYTRYLPGTGVTFSGSVHSPTPVLRLRPTTVNNRPRWVHCLQVYRL